MSKQVANGKAFEYSILKVFHNELLKVTKIEINKNSSYKNAKNFYDGFTSSIQSTFDANSKVALDFLLKVEPRLFESINNKDTLTLEIAADELGKTGDVRDVIFIRSEQDWEIGISAKNNHKAVKHSRLSPTLDFGQKWLNIPCSKQYFEEINIVFNELKRLKTQYNKPKWDVIDDKQEEVYVPILLAFQKELQRLNKLQNKDFAQNLIKYLVGTKDFYKIIKQKNKLEVQVYNLQGSLNRALGKIKPKEKVGTLKLPTRMIEVVFKTGSRNTLIVSLDEGWQISFRIHSASSKIETSLKFDIQLVSSPTSLFNQHLFL